MLFNSYNFVFLFLPAVLIGISVWTRLGWITITICWLGLASLIFYGVDHPEFLPVIIGSIVVNKIIGNHLAQMVSKRQRRGWLIFGVAFNLGLLGYFKYTGFLIEMLNDAGAASLSLPHIVLPIGISFYTFTQIAYLVDQYRLPHRYRFTDYMLFVSFFPHLVAGPILIHKQVIPQFRSPRMGRPSARRVMIGVVFFCLGMGKKVLLADNIAPYVGELFKGATTGLGAMEAWAGVLLYSLQLYFDFSGYSEMAFGLALFMNVRIPLNFNAPYRATSMVEFWRRWHMSLSRFLRDYLYVPLGGNRKGEPRRYLNIFLTMLLGGIWHGAGWTFAIWGLIHGIGIVLNHFWQRFRVPLPVWLSWLLTLLVVVHGWVFFRAANVTEASYMLQAMYGAHGWQPIGPLAARNELNGAVAWLAFGWGIVVLGPTTRRLALQRRPRVWLAVYSAVVLAMSVLNFGKVSEFLYFQF
jgi:alginate O-acetyltransferase complex protein AlgI